jgi:uncharacterized membrane protein HdeD (DUF308 family)
VAAKYILALAAVVFLVVGAMRLVRDGSVRHPQTRTWLLIAAIFATVSGWLFFVA